MRFSILLVVTALLGVSSAFLASCGDTSKLIPGSDATRLKSEVDRAAADALAGRCGHARDVIDSARNVVSSLPASVDPKLKTNLQQGLDTVGADAQDTCSKPSKPVKTTTTPTVTAANTTPTETATTSSQPTQTESVPTQSPPTTPTADNGGTPAGEGDGAGKGKGQG